jgi:hypothetical protein
MVASANVTVAAAEPDPAEPHGSAPLASGLQVLNYRTWVHDGVLHVVGEIRNTSTRRVNPMVNIWVSPGPVGNDSGVLASSVIGWSLAPGVRTGFHARGTGYPDAAITVNAISADAYVTNEPANAVGLSVVGPVGSDPALVGGTGDSVLYQIRNGTGRPIEVVQLVATFRSANGRVSNVGGGTLDVPIPIAAGATYDAWAGIEPSGVVAVAAEIYVIAWFSDGAGERVVTWSNWFHDTATHSLASSIVWLAERRITGGCAPYRFCPSGLVTRAQMAMFLDRALHFPSTSTDYFTDDNGVTGEASINRMAAAGVTGGCSATRYCPGTSVTRAQMAMFLDRALHFPSTSKDFFTDDEGVTGEAAINRMAAAGVTGGCGGTNFCPRSSVTRAQMAAFLKRALD